MKLIEVIEQALLGNAGEEANAYAVKLAVSILRRTKIVDCSDEEIDLIVRVIKNPLASLTS